MKQIKDGEQEKEIASQCGHVGKSNEQTDPVTPKFILGVLTQSLGLNEGRMCVQLSCPDQGSVYHHWLRNSFETLPSFETPGFSLLPARDSWGNSNSSEVFQLAGSQGKDLGVYSIFIPTSMVTSRMGGAVMLVTFSFCSLGTKTERNLACSGPPGPEFPKVQILSD